MPSDIVWLHQTTEHAVSEVGGKAASLIRLMAEGFSVPPGFCLTTGWYRELFLESGAMSDAIQRARNCDPNDMTELDEISRSVREVVMERPVNEQLEQRILSAYETLACGSTGTIPVAVRSSANAEDLPEASFAGQHESFLNVTDKDELIASVRRCWASLWTPKAISYRNHRGFDHGGVCLAVIVQEMVQCEISGVLFTENPNDENQREIVINASVGSPEGIVQGKVTADEFRFSKKTSCITLKKIAQGRSDPCLTDGEVLKLAILGQKIQQSLGSPQDAEWGIDGTHVFILQSRPITTTRKSLAKIIEKEKHHLKRSAPGTVWSDMMVSEVVSHPSPLSRELLKRFLSKNGSFGIFYEKDLGFGASFTDHILTFVCGRPFLNRTQLVRPFAFLGFPLKPFDYDWVKNDPGGANSPYPVVNTGKYGLRIGFFIAGAFLLLPYTLYKLGRTFYRTMRLAGSFGSEFHRQILPAYLKYIDERRGKPLEELTDAELASSIETMIRTLARESTMSHIKSEFLGDVVFQLLRLLVGDRSKKLLLGLDGDKHLEANLELWKLAQNAKPHLANLFAVTAGKDLPRELSGSAEGREFLAEFGRFLERYGHRAHNELELGEPRWREAPDVLFETIKAYLKAEGNDPLEHFAQQRKARQEIEEGIVKSMSSGLWDWPFRVRRNVFAKTLKFLHTYVPLRETTKFYYLMEVEQIRRYSLELGARLSGEKYRYLNNKHDVFHLTSDELQSLPARELDSKEVRETLLRRKTQYRLERMIPVPSVLFRDSLEEIGIDRPPRVADVLLGTGVSEGSVTGISKVIMNPSEIGTLEAGQILVAPTTDPGWTPLFLIVKGLVMNTGNFLSHGSVLAREYGLPTVVNVAGATEIIGSGRRITVNGTDGKVYLH